MKELKLKINASKIAYNTGLSFDDAEEYWAYILRQLEFLATHNKNYTKKQFFRISDIKEILENMEIKS